MTHDEFEQHRRSGTCTRARDQGLRTSGPDVLSVDKSGKTTVGDVTVINQLAPSYAGQPVQTLLDKRSALKDRAYAVQCQDLGYKFETWAWTANGEILGESKKLLGRLETEMRETRGCLAAQIAACAIYGTAAARLKAERDAHIAPPSVDPRHRAMASKVLPGVRRALGQSAADGDEDAHDDDEHTQAGQMYSMPADELSAHSIAAHLGVQQLIELAPFWFAEAVKADNLCRQQERDQRAAAETQERARLAQLLTGASLPPLLPAPAPVLPDPRNDDIRQRSLADEAEALAQLVCEQTVRDTKAILDAHTQQCEDALQQLHACTRSTLTQCSQGNRTLRNAGDRLDSQTAEMAKIHSNLQVAENHILAETASTTRQLNDAARRAEAAAHDGEAVSSELTDQIAFKTQALEQWQRAIVVKQNDLAATSQHAHNSVEQARQNVAHAVRSQQDWGRRTTARTREVSVIDAKLHEARMTAATVLRPTAAPFEPVHAGAAAYGQSPAVAEPIPRGVAYADRELNWSQSMPAVTRQGAQSRPQSRTQSRATTPTRQQPPTPTQQHTPDAPSPAPRSPAPRSPKQRLPASRGASQSVCMSADSPTHLGPPVAARSVSTINRETRAMSRAMSHETDRSIAAAALQQGYATPAPSFPLAQYTNFSAGAGVGRDASAQHYRSSQRGEEQQGLLGRLVGWVSGGGSVSKGRREQGAREQ
jgi:hypothetical protein